MYKVRYYRTGTNSLTSRLFPSFNEAMLFSVWRVKTGDVYSIDLIKD